jgi:toxin FitB
LSFLIDTNVLSELARERPDAKVESWFLNVPDDNAFVCAATWAELRRGVEQMPDGKRKVMLTDWLENTLLAQYSRYTIPIDLPVAQQWGRLVADAKKRGLNCDANDAYIAAAALVHGLTLVTRNTRDFEPLGVPVFNPWAA